MKHAYIPKRKLEYILHYLWSLCTFITLSHLPEHSWAADPLAQKPLQQEAPLPLPAQTPALPQHPTLTDRPKLLFQQSKLAHATEHPVHRTISRALTTSKVLAWSMSCRVDGLRSTRTFYSRSLDILHPLWSLCAFTTLYHLQEQSSNHGLRILSRSKSQQPHPTSSRRKLFLPR